MVVASVDESARLGEDVSVYLARIVLAKLDAVQRSLPPELAAGALATLTADTSVLLDGEILGKPASVVEAEQMIGRLAGRTHEVHTRFAVAARRIGESATSGAPGAVHAETVVTRVTFRVLSSQQARAYAQSGEGLDKAGAYAVQGLGASIVSNIDGSYTNVVGLPACEVVLALTNMGLLPA